MRFKKIIICFLMILQLLLCSACDYTKPNKSEAEAVTFDEIEKESPSINEECLEIYATYTGECYHFDGCVYLRSRVKTSAYEVKAMGLRPCSKCQPPYFE